MIAFVVFCLAAVGIAMFFYALGHIAGYVRGYSEGLAYGARGLEDYHRHTMEGLRSLRPK